VNPYLLPLKSPASSRLSDGGEMPLSIYPQCVFSVRRILSLVEGGQPERGGRANSQQSPVFSCRFDAPVFRASCFRHAISTTRLVRPAKYRGLDEHAYFDQGGTTPFVRA